MILSNYTKTEKKLFLKDPESTELGQKILNESIKLIDEIGFMNFNFKKLASRIDSTEASVYRYFENKHKLLFYMINWYWSWIKYTIDFRIHNIKKPKEKLRIIIRVISNSFVDDPETTYVDESILSRIVVTESTKAFTSKNVEEDYKDGLFEAYKEVCKKIAEIITAINPNYSRPKALAVSIINMIHKQLFFSRHLPAITDIQVTENDTSQLESFIEEMVFSVLKK